MRYLMFAACTIVVVGGLLCAPSAFARQRAASAPPQPSATAAPSTSGLYANAQAQRGEALYKENCAFCHGSELTGTISGPPINGPVLLAKWSGRPVSELFTFVQVFMPWNSPNGLSRQQNADVLAFMFKRADLPAGTTEFPPDAEAQNRLSTLAGK